MTSSTAATWSPSSLQLRLALRRRSCRLSPAVLVRLRERKLDHEVRLLCCVSQKGNERKRRRNGRIAADSADGSFAGWSDSDDGEKSIETQKNKWFGGAVGAGVAGVILVTGLTFAALSMGRRSTSKSKQQMEPLTTQQEALLTTDNETAELEEGGGGSRNLKEDDSSPHNRKALQVHPGKVLVPAVVDQIQGQALAALQVLKVIEADVQAGDLCTRREYARWLVSASNALSRNTMSKVYPAMYIENVTELAFDDITPEDPDFTSIQGLAEAGLISSKLSRRDFLSSSSENEGPFYFSPESPLSRQDLVSWKMALEKRHLPKADKKILYESSGFVDVDKINPDAWPALVADLATGEQGIIALAFGCTRLFQPDKPVTKAQAAVAIATGEASDIVSEELARIEAESIAENAVAAHSALVAQVEKDVNANFDKELSMEREKVDAVEKMAEEAKQELQRLRAQREEDNIALMREHAAIDSQMEVLSKLRREVEEQLESLMNNKVEISYEKERINKLRQEAENENQEIARLQYQLEVERKALSMARTWAEEEAKRAREQAKALEEARDRWERHGIKVVVGSDLHEESSERVTWLNAGKQFSVKETVSRAENLVEKLRIMANDVKGKSREVIDKIIHKILSLISDLKEWACKTSARANELKHTTILKARESAQDWQRITTELNLAVKEGTKRLAIDCREGVEKISQKFKT
ncbi:plectin-like isoform X4 [Tripterygium wilfordii]|uniref:plectin-like isoform X4 n=1 Tax=Tripterygium wilfordii TaxID=458696 RepID=UPI0018F8029D|nr:plectin-like isoform X4 [Tripterygium wilfordii]